jgi:hypothetical protein
MAWSSVDFVSPVAQEQRPQHYEHSVQERPRSLLIPKSSENTVQTARHIAFSETPHEESFAVFSPNTYAGEEEPGVRVIDFAPAAAPRHIGLYWV